MMATSIVAFKWLQFTSPIQTWSKTLTVTSCGQPDIQVSVQGKPEPCLKHKLHSLFPEDQECELICNHQDPKMYSSTKINFKGENAFIMEEQLILSLTLQNPKTDEEEFKNSCKIYDQCLIQCDDENLNRVLNVPNFEKNEVFEYPNFWFIFYAWIIGATACNGVAALQDAIATQCCENHISGETFGHQRLWASVGWGSSALLVGYLVDLASADQLLFDYSPAFGVLTFLWILDIFIIMKLPISSNVVKIAANPFKDIAKILYDKKVMIFMVYTTTVGVLLGSLTQVFILLEDLGHRSDCNGVQAMKFLQGLVLAINCIAETPIFLYSGKLIKRYGTTTVMHAILFIFALRMFFYGIMISPWQVIFIEGSNGIIVGLFYPAVTSISFQIAPDNLSTTTTSVAYFMEGLGIAMGSWIAGSLSQLIGVSSTFLCFGLFASVAFIVHYIILSILRG